MFLNTLDKIDGAKDLVLSRTILVQLDSICGMTKLRQNAVDKVFKLQASPVISETRNRVYVIRPSIEEVKLVSEQINTYLETDDDKYGPADVRFWIIFVPRFAYFCNVALEEEGIYEYVSILECPMGLLPLEYDVYSLEDETIFKSLFLNRDITPLSDIVNAISQLQILSGSIHDVYGQGSFAKTVADKLDHYNLKAPSAKKKAPRDLSYTMTNEFDGLQLNGIKPSEPESSTFTDLYLIDRDCDFASLLLSQLNYEGILDESFRICCNKLEYATTTSGSDEKTSVKHSLSSDNDPIFRDIRDNHFSTVFSLLRSKNHEMKAKYNRSQDMNLSNLKQFVATELKGLQAEFKCLALHISACEELMKERNKYDFAEQLRCEQNIIDGVEIRRCLDYITKMIAHQLNPHVPLRLLSLLSLTLGGLPQKDYRRYHSLYCENYGLPNNVTFDNLKKLGLVTEMNFSLTNLAGGLLNYGSSSDVPSKSTKIQQSASSFSLASFTGVMSNLTERASGRMAAVVSSSVLPRRGNLSTALKRFQLLPEIGDAGYNIREPKDPAFVFGGAYIPLICQLLENCVLGTTKKNGPPLLTPQEIMKLLPGPNFKRKQAFLSPDIPNNITNKPQSERSILIFFIGGVTFAEITALRFMAKQRNIKIAVGTTSIINGNKLIESLFPKSDGA